MSWNGMWRKMLRLHMSGIYSAAKHIWHEVWKEAPILSLIAPELWNAGTIELERTGVPLEKLWNGMEHLVPFCYTKESSAETWKKGVQWLLIRNEMPKKVNIRKMPCVSLALGVFAAQMAMEFTWYYSRLKKLVPYKEKTHASVIMCHHFKDIVIMWPNEMIWTKKGELGGH